MKHYDVITIFPEMFDAIADYGVTRRALDEKAWALRCWNPRDFANDNYRTIDDRPFGGGPGMVMKASPLAAAIRTAKAKQQEAGAAGKVIYLSPAARPIDDGGIRQLGSLDALIFVCGRYEGVDERFIEAHVDEEVSIGNYVLSGGELAAMVLIDAMVRLLPGVLNDGQSAVEDSFSPARGGWLDHPHYTRPDSWNGVDVPPVLMGGNHAEITKWRHRMALMRTWQRRPDLLDESRMSNEDLRLLNEIRRTQKEQQK